MEIFKFIQFFIFKIADLSAYYIKFSLFIFKKNYKNKLKSRKLTLKFFINLKIYTESNSPLEMEYNKNSIKNLKGVNNYENNKFL